MPTHTDIANRQFEEAIFSGQFYLAEDGTVGGFFPDSTASWIVKQTLQHQHGIKGIGVIPPRTSLHLMFPDDGVGMGMETDAELFTSNANGWGTRTLEVRGWDQEKTMALILTPREIALHPNREEALKAVAQKRGAPAQRIM